MGRFVNNTVHERANVKRGDSFVLSRLLLVVGAVAAPLVVLIAFSIADAREAAEQRAYAQLKARADQGAQEISSVLDRAEHLISFMATRQRFRLLEVEACQSLVAGVTLGQTAYTNVGLFDVAGNPICTSSPRVRRTNFADASWFKAGIAAEGLLLSPVQRGALSGRLVVYLTKPVHNDGGEKVGLMSVALDLEGINDRLRFLTSRDFSITVRQADTVFTRLPRPEAFVGKRIPAAVINAQTLSNVPIRVAPNIEGEIRAFTATPVPKYGLEVVAGMPEPFVYQEAHEVAVRSVIIALVALLLGLIAAAVAARRLTSAVASVGHTAQLLHAGAQDVRADTSLPGVFGSVATEFNRLMDRNRDDTRQLMRSAQEAVRLRRFYETLSETGQAVAHQVNTQELFDVVCAACTTSELAASACVWQRVGGDLVLVAKANVNQDVFAEETIERIKALACRAIDVAQPALNDVDQTTSAVAVPFTVDAEPLGAVVLTTQIPGWFDDELVRLLAELGRDVSFGLHLERTRGAATALAAAQAANKAKSSFLSHVSHELRTPLNAVMGFAQLSNERPAARDDEVLRGYLGHVLVAARHLKLLIDDLMDVSRIDLGEMTVEFDDVDLCALLCTAVDLQRPAAAEHNITLRFLAPKRSPIYIHTDPGRLRQILTNLISNAVKYNRSGGEVHVGAHVQAAEVVITVKDNGVGMTPAQVEGLFQAFNRLGREKSAVEGTGIGLYITKRVVDLLGGELRIESQEGMGTVAVVRLPLGAATANEGNIMHPASASGVGSADASQVTGLVLYIEDNPVNAVLVEQWFKMHTAATLEIRGTGSEGLVAAEALTPDLILLDMQLPDMHGMDVLRRLKAADTTKHIRVVALSANAMRQDIDEAAAAGAEDYWAKPIDFDAMERGVAKYLGHGRRPDGATDDPLGAHAAKRF